MLICWACHTPLYKALLSGLGLSLTEHQSISHFLIKTPHFACLSGAIVHQFSSWGGIYRRHSKEKCKWHQSSWGWILFEHVRYFQKWVSTLTIKISHSSLLPLAYRRNPWKQDAMRHFLIKPVVHTEWQLFKKLFIYSEVQVGVFCSPGFVLGLLAVPTLPSFCSYRDALQYTKNSGQCGFFCLRRVLLYFNPCFGSTG